MVRLPLVLLSCRMRKAGPGSFFFFSLASRMNKHRRDLNIGAKPPRVANLEQNGPNEPA